MSLFKKVYDLLLGIIACVIVLLLADTGRFFGVFVNRFFPCVANPAISFPCYGVYDIAVIILAFIVGLVLIGIIIFRLTHSRFRLMLSIVIIFAAIVFAGLWIYFSVKTPTSNSSEIAATTAQAEVEGPIDFTGVHVDTADWLTYTDSELGYSFQYPPDWTVSKLDLSDPALQGKEGSGFEGYRSVIEVHPKGDILTSKNYQTVRNFPNVEISCCHSPDRTYSGLYTDDLRDVYQLYGGYLNLQNLRVNGNQVIIMNGALLGSPKTPEIYVTAGGTMYEVDLPDDENFSASYNAAVGMIRTFKSMALAPASETQDFPYGSTTTLSDARPITSIDPRGQTFTTYGCGPACQQDVTTTITAFPETLIFDGNGKAITFSDLAVGDSVVIRGIGHVEEGSMLAKQVFISSSTMEQTYLIASLDANNMTIKASQPMGRYPEWYYGPEQTISLNQEVEVVKGTSWPTVSLADLKSGDLAYITLMADSNGHDQAIEIVIASSTADILP